MATIVQPRATTSGSTNIAPEPNGSVASDGAQDSSKPVVPWCQAMTGCASLSSGATTMPLATAAVPSPWVVV